MRYEGITLRQAGAWLKAGDPSVKGDIEVVDALADPEFGAIYVVWRSKRREDRYDRAASSTDPEAIEKLYRTEPKETVSVVWINDGEKGGISPAAERLDKAEIETVKRRIGKRRVARKAPDTVQVVD